MANHTIDSALERALGQLEQVTPGQALILCAVLYAAVTGAGLMIEGYNFDDWRHLGQTPALWAGAEGRWAMDFLYRYILQERFHLPLQILLAFACLFGCSYLLARYAVGERQAGLATIFIFLIGTHHIYMSSALMFNAHIFAFPLAFAFSLLAFHLVYAGRKWRGFGAKLGLVLVASQLLALSLALYQPYGLFGLAIPVLVVALYDRYAIRREFAFLLLCVAVCVLGLILYRFEWSLYLALQDRTIEVIRFETPTLADVVNKILALPGFLTRIYAGTLVPAPFYLKLANALAAAAALGAILFAAFAALTDRAEASAKARAFAAGRVVIASGTMLAVLPVLFWFLYKEHYTPGRTVAFIAFWLPALMLALLALTVRRQATALARGALLTGVLALGAVSCASVLGASETWTDRARIDATDRNIARAVYARVGSLAGHAGGPFRVVGKADYSAFSRGGQLGWTTLHENNPKLGIFKGMFNLPDYIASYAISPLSCEAMPSASAGYVFEGVAYVCLEAKRGFLPLSNCVDIGREGVGRICLKDEMVFHVAPDCTDRLGPRRSVYVAHRDAAGALLRLARFEEKEIGLELSSGCYMAVRDLDQPYAALDIGIYELGKGVIWTMRVDRAAFDAR